MEIKSFDLTLRQIWRMGKSEKKVQEISVTYFLEEEVFGNNFLQISIRILCGGYPWHLFVY